MTLNLDPAAVEAAITQRTKAILAVDIFGFPCELEALRELAGRHGLALIEDACEALGAEYRGRPIGSYEHPAVFAFYPNKQVTTGEGGAIAVHSEAEWRLLKSLANQGRADSGGWLEHARLRLQLPPRRPLRRGGPRPGREARRDPRASARRPRPATRSCSRALDGVEPLCPDDADHRRSWFVYPVRLPAAIDRELVIARLAESGIGTARYLPSIHLQPYMRERFGYREGMLPVSEEASRRLLALPFFTEIAPGQQERVVAARPRRSRRSG